MIVELVRECRCPGRWHAVAAPLLAGA